MTTFSDGFQHALGSNTPTAANDGDGFYINGAFGGASIGSQVHAGEDWYREAGSTQGQAVFAASNGRVAEIGFHNVSGYYVVIDHDLPAPINYNGKTTFVISTMYADLTETHAVKVGDIVSKGQLISNVGIYPDEVPHLHFELRLGPASEFANSGIVSQGMFSSGYVNPSGFINAYQNIAAAGPTNGDDQYAGASEADLLEPLAGDDTVFGREGDDTIIGSGGDDRLFGMADDDRLFGGFGADRLDGGDGDDLMRSGPGNDTLVGGEGGDTLGASNRSDLLRGEGGDDLLIGSNGNDRLFGDDGADTIVGGNGRDQLSGGADNDRMNGGGGADTLVGQEGDDTLIGGSGGDRFVFNASTPGADVILAFEAGGTDEILLLGFGAAFDSFADVEAAASQAGADTLIDLGGGYTILLQGITKSDLTVDNFVFG